MVLDFLTEPVGQPGEPPHPHSHREVLAFDVTRRNEVVERFPGNHFLPGFDTFGGTVSHFVTGRIAVNLDEHGVVDITTKSVFHCLQVSLVAVCRQLNPVAQSARQIGDEHACCLSVPRSDKK